MKRLSIIGCIGCIVAVFLVVGSAYAADRGMYVGIGGTIAVEYFNGNDFDNVRPYGFDPNYDNTWGINGKFGYKINPVVSVEAVIEYLSGFSASQTFPWDSTSQAVFDSDVDVFTIMAAAKLYAPLPGIVKPYFAVGLGLMNATFDQTVTAPGYLPSSSSTDQTNPCGKLGLGVDIFITPTLSVNVEGAYTSGFGDLDTVRYFGLSAGMGFHF
jgi:opacity protein-like surface antigen